MNSDNFSTLPLKQEMLANLKELGYTAMTPIQAQSLPYILNKRDVRAKAKTGSGKTAAFGIGVLHNLNVKRFRVQTLVLCPTRELADQVAKELRRLARATHNVKILTLCGGMPFGPQLGSLDHGAHIIVGTPGRVLKHLGKGSLNFDDLTMLVLDEADRMLDMGFAEEIDAIIEQTPSSRQTLLFSATYPEQIEKMGSSVLRDPVDVSIESVHTQSTIRQIAYEHNDKDAALVRLLSHYRPESSIIFCNMKITCQEVADMLQAQGFSAEAIHGDLEQIERNEVLVKFGNGSCAILVATDVAARGLDIKALEAVVNYDLPRDPEVYVHRIGRTGRAGNEGLALSVYEDTQNDIVALEDIESYQKQGIERGDITELSSEKISGIQGAMTTLCIDGGRKQKVRPGDILGALTGEAGIKASSVGKIDIFDKYAYVAIKREDVDEAHKQLSSGRIKGRSFRVWKMDA